MKKQVRETAAGQSISAWVILNKKGGHVATVQAHYSNAGRVTVDIWTGETAAVLKSYRAALTDSEKEAAEKAALADRDYLKDRPEDLEEWAAFDVMNLQQGAAGGYNYDKLTAALAGLWIDGHCLVDHCGRADDATEKKKERLLKAYKKAAAAPGFDQEPWDKKARKLGASFANWDNGHYHNLYFDAGLDRLRALGYRVISAI